jgi:hypothetical protein
VGKGAGNSGGGYQPSRLRVQGDLAEGRPLHRIEGGLGGSRRRRQVMAGWAHAQGLFGSSGDWNWPETLDTEYETDKPDFDGWGAVHLWAAYAGQPTASRPQAFSRDWTGDAALASLAGVRGSEFGHIIDPELWLPVSFDEVVEAGEPNGNRCKIGSVPALWGQMRHLNDFTWKTGDSTIRGWRQDGFEPTNLESVARWGFSIWFCLTEFAVEHRVPMRLDY